MVFLVGEIGVNWDGDFELLKKIIKKTKEIGIDAVKFQAFNEEIVKDHPEKKRLLSSSISKSNIEQINQITKNMDLEWFCTPMYPEAVDLLEPYVNRFKIRHGDGIKIVKGEYSPILEKILKTNKEIIISTQKNPSQSKFFNESKIKWLYCVPKYPCNLSELDFSEMGYFNGFSNHCPEVIAPLTAAILGAEIIETHITSNKSKHFVDNDVSFDYDELSELVKIVRLSEKIKK